MYLIRRRAARKADKRVRSPPPAEKITQPAAVGHAANVDSRRRKMAQRTSL